MLPVWPFLRDRAHPCSRSKPLPSRGRLLRFSFRCLRMRVSIARARLLFPGKMDERLHHPHAVPRATGCSLRAIHLHVLGTELTFRQRTEWHGHPRWQGATRVSQRDESLQGDRFDRSTEFWEETTPTVATRRTHRRWEPFRSNTRGAWRPSRVYARADVQASTHTSGPFASRPSGMDVGDFNRRAV